MDGLSRIGKKYFYRRRVPADLVAIIGKTEIKKSLGTIKYSEAATLARLIAADTDKNFFEARIMSKFDQQTIQKLAARLYNERVNQAEQNREQIDYANPMRYNDSMDDFTVERLLATPNGADLAALVHSKQAEGHQLQIKTGAYLESEALKQIADNMLSDSNIAIDHDSPDYKKLLRHLEIAASDADKVNADRYQGEYPGGTELAVANKYPVTSGKLLLEVLDEFLAFRSNRQKPETADSYRSILRLFTELIGNRPIDDYTTHDIVTHRDLIAKLPTTRSGKYKHLSATELIKMELPAETKIFSTRNIKKHIDKVVTIFNYAYDQGYTPRPIGHNTQPVITNSLVNSQKYRPYTSEDLQLMFFTHITHRKINPHIGWMPLLALFTGARRGELAQLRLDEIKQVDGIWCMDILTEYDDRDERNIKTESSRRFTPLHPILIDCGLLEYTRQRRKDKKTTLFDIVAENYGKTFGRVKDKLPDPERKSFHSFRGTMTNQLKQAMVSSDLYHNILGHSAKHDTEDNYTEDYSVKNKYHAILKLDTFGLDRDLLIKTYKIYLP